MRCTCNSIKSICPDCNSSNTYSWVEGDPSGVEKKGKCLDCKYVWIIEKS